MTPMHVIHNGLDPSFWKRPKERDYSEPLSFIAVISNKSQLYLKCIYDIIEVAKKLPNNPFLIVGSSPPSDKTSLPENIKFQERVSPEKLRELYHSHHFHLQLSLFEGFGYALAEAMLCGCIPIGSSVISFPERFGSSAFILDTGDLPDFNDPFKMAQ